MKKYTWKRAWDAKGIPAEKAVKIFEEIEQKFGKLTPETLVEHSKNKKSPLYKLFEWDNEKAADKWRLQQARMLINNVEVTVISDGKPVDIGAFEITMNENSEKSYKNVQAMSFNEIEYVRDSTLQTLIQVQKKLKVYNRFNNISFDIDQAIEKLKVVDIKK
jgi:hypothetical protein